MRLRPTAPSACSATARRRADLRVFALTQGGLRRGAFGKALRYLLAHWNGLPPGVPLDNNAAEHVLRGAVVGRKNFCGNRSRRGAKMAAIFYCLFETAKLQGRKPTRLPPRRRQGRHSHARSSPYSS